VCSKVFESRKTICKEDSLGLGSLDFFGQKTGIPEQIRELSEIKI
jgi:hypothetical protein